MNLLLYCDEYCYKYDGRYYLEEFGLILLNRYLDVFDTIKYPVRVKEVSNKEELGSFNKLIDSSRVEVVEIPYGHGMNDYIKHYIQIRTACKNVCKNCDFAILRMPSIYSFSIWHQVKKDKLPYAVEIVFDCYDGYLSSSTLKDKLSWKLMHKWQQQACAGAEGVACVTESYLQKRYFPSKSDAIVSHYSSIELPSSFYYRERKYPQTSPFEIIHVAYQVSFNSRKGHNQLIEALQKVRQQGLDVEIAFVGGNYDNGFEKLSNYADELGVKDHISFLGFMSRGDIRNLMTESTLAVLPTKAEGLPRVIIEAMATGLPCISTHVSGNSELLEDKYLLDYSDVDKLSKTICSILKDPMEYERVSKKNFERSKCYEAEYLQKRRVDFYTKLRKRIENQNDKF